jgi:hypothetical protein
VDVSEQQLEDLVRRHTGMIEEGLAYIDHHKATAGKGLAVLKKELHALQSKNWEEIHA